MKQYYADSWKSIEYLKKNKLPIFVLAHGTEIQKNFNSWNFYKENKQVRIYNSYNNANKIAANSNYTKELLNESLSIELDKITVIHPGIDIYDQFINASIVDKISNYLIDHSPILLTLATKL